MKNAIFLGLSAKVSKPTRKHWPAIWENMLGTVYAMNAAGEAKYFDYDHEAARAWAGVHDMFADLRVSRMDGRYRYVKKGGLEMEPRKGQLVLWIKRF